MEFEHKKLGKCILVEIKQKQLEEFSRLMQGKDKEPLSVWRGDSVRAAAKLGLLTEPALKLEDIDNQKPALIVWLSDCIAKVISEALNLDPLS